MDLPDPLPKLRTVNKWDGKEMKQETTNDEF
jgi:hypothetical protein